LAKNRSGPPLPQMISFLNGLGSAYFLDKQYAKAEPLLAEVLPHQRRLFPPKSPQLAGALANLGWCRLKLEKWADAEDVLREALEIREAVSQDDWVTASVKSVLGETLLGQRNHAEAEPLLLAGYDGLAAHWRDIPPQARSTLFDAADRLVKLNNAFGKSDEAEKWGKKREGIWGTGPQPPASRPFEVRP